MSETPNKFSANPAHAHWTWTEARAFFDDLHDYAEGLGLDPRVHIRTNQPPESNIDLDEWVAKHGEPDGIEFRVEHPRLSRVSQVIMNIDGRENVPEISSYPYTLFINPLHPIEDFNLRPGLFESSVWSHCHSTDTVEDARAAILQWKTDVESVAGEPWVTDDIQDPPVITRPAMGRWGAIPPEHVKQRFLEFYATVHPPVDEAAKKKRGKGINVRTLPMIGATHSMRAVNQAMMNPSKGTLSEDQWRSDNPANNGLAVAIVPDQEWAYLLPQIVKGMGALDLKVMTGSVRAWADATGANRYNDYAEVPLSTIIRASGASSSLNETMYANYGAAFVRLAQMWAQVPKIRYVSGGRQNFESTDYQRVVVSDQIQVVKGLFEDDVEFNLPQIWQTRYHLGEFVFQTFFGKSGDHAQYIKLAEKALQYDANRQESIIKLIFYYLPLVKIQSAKGPQSKRFKATTVCDAACITPVFKNLGPWIDRFKDWHSTLVKDGVIANVSFDEPGEKFPPRVRFEQMGITIEPR